MAGTVVVRGLRKRYGGVAAVDGVSFDVSAGEIFGLIGPNGAGKTTTVECLVGLRVPDEGSIELCGIDARARPREVKRRIGASLQTTALQDTITPREALQLFASFYPAAADPSGLLDRFALGDKADAAFETLSGGQRQRLALALAFVNRPEVVLLDEPTAGLDPQSRRELHGEIARMKREGHTVLLTTHDLDEAEQLCDRIAIISHGRLIASGTPRDLIARSERMQMVRIATAPPIDPGSIAALPGVQDVTSDGAVTRLRTTTVNRTLGELVRMLDAHDTDLIELHVQKASLEDVFIELTTAAPAASGAAPADGRA
jgi:ABC-2 type transport system ATP-binding protein